MRIGQIINVCHLYRKADETTTAIKNDGRWIINIDNEFLH
jgi:hypothetical protein